MRWQDLFIFFKKRSRSRTLWISSGSGMSILAIFAYVSLLSGVTITSNGNVVCQEECTIYCNITSTYWEICFNSTDFSPLYFEYHHQKD